jgi:hypothetical protein
MSYLERPSWWYNQIRGRARSLWILVVSLIVVLFIALGFFVYVQIYLPDGGYIWIFTISPDLAKILRFLGTSSSVIGVSVLLRRLLRKRTWLMYQQVARSLINNLRDKNKISEECYKELSSIIQTHLSPCSEGGNKEGCLDGLLRASCELSNTLAKYRQP